LRINYWGISRRKGTQTMKSIILFTLVVSLTIIATLNNSSLAFNGNGNPLVTFTEISSTELTANIGSVVNLGPDLWSWSPPPFPEPLGSFSLGSSTYYWVEPENANLGNRITLHTPTFRIQSDVDVTGEHAPPWIPYPDGAIQYNQLWIEDANGVLHVFDAQFFDQGDAGTQVPEPTTVLLLGSGLLGLWGARKKFKK